MTANTPQFDLNAFLTLIDSGHTAAALKELCDQNVTTLNQFKPINDAIERHIQSKQNEIKSLLMKNAKMLLASQNETDRIDKHSQSIKEAVEYLNDQIQSLCDALRDNEEQNSLQQRQLNNLKSFKQLLLQQRQLVKKGISAC